MYRIFVSPTKSFFSNAAAPVCSALLQRLISPSAIIRSIVAGDSSRMHGGSAGVRSVSTRRACRGPESRQLGQITRETRLNLRRHLQGMPEENQGRICEIRSDATLVVLGLFALKIDDAAAARFPLPVRRSVSPPLSAATRYTGKTRRLRERRDFSVQMRHLRLCSSRGTRS